METKRVNKKSRDALSKAPYRRRKGQEMALIVRQIQSGYISKRAACFKYGLNRNTLKKWIVRLSVSNLADGISQEILAAMPEEKQIIALQKKIKELRFSQTSWEKSPSGRARAMVLSTKMSCKR